MMNNIIDEILDSIIRLMCLDVIDDNNQLFFVKFQVECKNKIIGVNARSVIGSNKLQIVNIIRDE